MAQFKPNRNVGKAAIENQAVRLCFQPFWHLQPDERDEIRYISLIVIKLPFTRFTATHLEIDYVTSACIGNSWRIGPERTSFDRAGPATIQE